MYTKSLMLSIKLKWYSLSAWSEEDNKPVIISTRNQKPQPNKKRKFTIAYLLYTSFLECKSYNELQSSGVQRNFNGETICIHKKVSFEVYKAETEKYFAFRVTK